jgi:hypothetical protein
VQQRHGGGGGHALGGGGGGRGGLHLVDLGGLDLGRGRAGGLGVGAGGVGAGVGSGVAVTLVFCLVCFCGVFLPLANLPHTPFFAPILARFWMQPYACVCVAMAAGLEACLCR